MWIGRTHAPMRARTPARTCAWFGSDLWHFTHPFWEFATNYQNAAIKQ